MDMFAISPSEAAVALTDTGVERQYSVASSLSRVAQEMGLSYGDGYLRRTGGDDCEGGDQVFLIAQAPTDACKHHFRE
eukprot:1685820-Amphidinium_carterae.4